MPKLSEQLRVDAIYHGAASAKADDPTVSLERFNHSNNCVVASYALDTAETIIKRLLLRVQVGDSAAIDARKFLEQLNGEQHAKT